MQEFSQLLASTEEPIPAGGSTIATTALLGVSLLQLVSKVSSLSIDLEELEKNLLKSIDADVQAFKLNQQKQFKDKESLKEIINTPLEIAKNSALALELATEIRANVKKSVKADYQVAIFNLRASIKGAIAIIESNYQFFTTDDYIQQIKEEIEELNKLLK
ncbi:cyclodeaminase/cyclohydrolase family protein [Orenia metallireducens]|uniref:cyclodeaminase/cyclohydrolase family protein n=1 Tax=Orenia metallireducens TaxID=1413210 RepID=UPI003CCBA62D